MTLYACGRTSQVVECNLINEVVECNLINESMTSSLFLLYSSYFSSASDRDKFRLKGGPIKTGTRLNFCDNFGKCTPIFIILSSADSLVNV